MAPSPIIIFIQYRTLMVLDDHSVLWALYFDTVAGEVQIDITDQMATIPGEPDAEIQQTASEQRADVLMKPIKQLIPQYGIEPRGVFATFAHNLKHEVHHPQDYLEALKFMKKFKLSPDDVLIVELCVDSHDQPVLASSGAAKPFSDYFRRQIERAAAQSAE